MKLPEYWGGFQRLVDDIHAEIRGETPAAKPVMVKAVRTDADAASFWGRRPVPANKPKLAVMIKAKPGPSRAEVKCAGQAKLAGYVAEADRLARSGQLSGVEGAHVDAQIARMAAAVARL